MSIKVGDLVMVAKPMPCCGNGVFGKVFQVVYIKNEKARCPYCKKLDEMSCAGFDGQYLTTGYPIDRLIKIDPPSLPESLEREKELSV